MNPFSTRYIRPGAMPYIYGDGADAGALIARLENNDWRGAIIGPHGSGKSTLLADLLPRLRQAGRQPRLITLRDGQRRLPDTWIGHAPSGDAAMWIVDGFEQLGRLARFRLRRRVARRGGGLLVTSHRPTDWPTIWRATTDADLAERIVSRLVGGFEESGFQVTNTQLAEQLVEHGGNLREVLFDLYDRFAQHHRAGTRP